MNKQFAQDVMSGLSSQPKFLSSKYFYNKKGDVLFQKIMELDEYYLTRSEFEILDTHKQEILETIGSGTKFQLIELGAGDGLKTKILLKHFLDKEANFEYVPVDISANALNGLEHSVTNELPGLQIKIVVGDYFEILKDITTDKTVKNVVLFLGSNIGNFSEEEISVFLQSTAKSLNSGDLVLIGFDLKKDPSKILLAYDDSQGVTREFNLNLLDRINGELGGDFDKDKFMHYPTYNPETGKAESFILSKIDQVVTIRELDTQFHFDEWEPIHLEISRKFTKKELNKLAENAGFIAMSNLTDREGNFVDAIWKLR